VAYISDILSQRPCRSQWTNKPTDSPWSSPKVRPKLQCSGRNPAPDPRGRLRLAREGGANSYYLNPCRISTQDVLCRGLNQLASLTSEKSIKLRMHDFSSIGPLARAQPKQNKRCGPELGHCINDLEVVCGKHSRCTSDQASLCTDLPTPPLLVSCP
jgi:hypothetical protein